MAEEGRPAEQVARPRAQLGRELWAPEQLPQPVDRELLLAAERAGGGGLEPGEVAQRPAPLGEPVEVAGRLGEAAPLQVGEADPQLGPRGLGARGTVEQVALVLADRAVVVARVVEVVGEADWAPIGEADWALIGEADWALIGEADWARGGGGEREGEQGRQNGLGRTRFESQKSLPESGSSK
ncbi:MAG: hypothetical protein ACYCWW_16735 [Deltaproteobacteria bacterium]